MCFQSVAYSNGTDELYTYDPYRDFLTGITLNNASSTELQRFEYDYEANGWRDVMRQYDNGSLTYNIDYDYLPSGRLDHEIRNNGSGQLVQHLDYSYDVAGNRTQLDQILPGGVTNTTTYGYSTDGLNQLQTVTAGGVTTTYTYDDRGNVDTISDGTKTTDFTFDARNKITDIDITEGGNTTNIDYTYDADGYRTSQTITESGNSAVTTTYVWDPLTAYGDVIFETDGTTERHYTRANGLLLAQQDGTGTNYLTHDAQGGIRGVMGSTGMGFDVTYEYNAFGDFYDTSTISTKFAYTGQQYDDETGLYFLRARYYDPATGRFLSQDPYPVNTGNPMELNRYVYTANNPVNYTDPSGLTIGVYAKQTETSAEAAQFLGPIGVAAAAIFTAFAVALLVSRLIEDIEAPDLPDSDKIIEGLKNSSALVVVLAAMEKVQDLTR